MKLALAVTLTLGLVALVAPVLVSRPALLDAQEDRMATTARVASSVPAIDLKVPAKVETATFALG